MNSTRTRVDRLIVGGLTALAIFWSGTAVAQQQRSLRVVDGEVYVDDRRIPPEELPSGFEPEGMTVHYTFSGDVQPVLRLGDRFYVVDDEGLRVADDSERGSFFAAPRIRDFVPPDVHVEFRQDPAIADPPPPAHAVVFDRHAEALREQAVRLEELQRTLRDSFTGQQVQEFEHLAHEMSRHAAETAQMASDLPRIELRAYLDEIRRRNEGLFDQLVSERRLEYETLDRARRIRELTDGDERRSEIEALRSELDRIFELKQDNRRREIEQLERRLEELESRLAERERLREEIVDRRLHELLGRESMDW